MQLTQMNSDLVCRKMISKVTSVKKWTKVSRRPVVPSRMTSRLDAKSQ